MIALRPSSGVIALASTVVTTTASGARRNAHVVVTLYTAPLRTSFRRSAYSCQMGGPRRPVSIARVFVATPGMSGAATSSTPNENVADKMAGRLVAIEVIAG